LPSTNQQLVRFWIGCDKGQTSTEYAVVVSVITLTIVTTFGVMSGSIQTALGRVAGLL
jgi:Flp pilus assembly pilin Flp